jgi:alpha-beta hydrolase superfamily lysophospholipase
VEPFYFGPKDQRLFGVYHAPSVRRKVPAGAVLCYPFLQEYVRSHRAFLRLAMQLVGRGWHVLRFDYSGCGDSYGNGPSGPDAWAQDLRLATRELRERAGTIRLALIGLRLGASLAASVAPNVQPLDKLILWDPVVNGPDYLRELDEFRHAAALSPAYRRNIERFGQNDRGVGYNLAPEILQSIGRLDLAMQLGASADQILVLDTQESNSTAHFARRLAESRNVTLKRLSERPVWIERKRNDPRNIKVPTASLQAIVDWMSGTDA